MTGNIKRKDYQPELMKDYSSELSGGFSETFRRLTYEMIFSLIGNGYVARLHGRRIVQNGEIEKICIFGE